MKKIQVRFRTILAIALAAMSHPGSAPAQDQSSAASSAPDAAISAASSTNRAAWQQRLTLGPGDVLNLSLYGDPTPTEIWPNVVIEPDGRINYLEARNIPAAGLTIDELRTNLDAAL